MPNPITLGMDLTIWEISWLLGTLRALKERPNYGANMTPEETSQFAALFSKFDSLAGSVSTTSADGTIQTTPTNETMVVTPKGSLN